jgi:hypothetical protein
MGERITADNLDELVKTNRDIYGDMLQKVILVRTNWNSMQIKSSAQLSTHILRMYGLVQAPVDNVEWSGAIFVKNEKKIPVINTAQPRANQFFAAWMEIYHLIFDQVLVGRFIEAEMVFEDRKAQYFASLMTFGNLVPYFNMLSNMEFVTKVFHCMDTFCAPYKAVLIALYEEAVLSGSDNIMRQIMENFDSVFPNMDELFRMSGLDDSIVMPSNIVNVTALRSKIQDRIKKEPELEYHHTNQKRLDNFVNEIGLIS